MKKVVEKKEFNRRPRMFNCIRLRKRQHCCKPEIGGETQFTNKLSSESSKDQIQYRTMCERSIMWYCSTQTLVIFFWDGHGFILKRLILKNVPFIWGMTDMNWSEIYDTKTSQEGSTYIDGENRKRRNINCRRKGNWRKRKGSKEKDYEKGSREQGV